MRILNVKRQNELLGRLIVDAGVYLFYYMPGQYSSIYDFPHGSDRFTYLPYFFATRIMSEKRPEYDEYLAKLGLVRGCSNIDILAEQTEPSYKDGYHFEEIKLV